MRAPGRPEHQFSSFLNELLIRIWPNEGPERPEHQFSSPQGPLGCLKCVEVASWGVHCTLTSHFRTELGVRNTLRSQSWVPEVR